MQQNAITIEAIISAPIEKVWKYWNEPAHITAWAFATPEWHVPSAQNDLRVDGKFNTRMEAKDGSFGFDFEGIYSEVLHNQAIGYTMPDGRKVRIVFSEADGKTRVVETFDPENQNPLEMQQAGWQAILDNFKRYTEAN